MKYITIFLLFLLSLGVYADTVQNVEKGEKEGSVSKRWVMDILEKGSVDNVVFMDARPMNFYTKQHTDTIGYLDPDIFYEDGGCEKALSMIPKDKIVILICPGPRAQESYQNLTDSTAGGGCGYTGGNVYWIRTNVVYHKDHIEVK
ncbi:MAG: hypothetical protein AB7F25_12005 [Deferribacterales bacterium]